MIKFISEKEAELIGAHCGDGTLYKVKNSLVWELRGSVEEKEYYEFIFNLLIDLFGIDLKPKFRKPNAWGIQTSNKIITNFFVKNGFKPGSKVYTVKIPDYIKKSDEKIKLAYIRGLFDTDGCIRFEKRKIVNPYPRIEFGFASRNLRDDLLNLLNKLRFRCYKWDSFGKYVSYKIGLAGFDNLDKWFKEVKPSNTKHFKRKNGLK